MSMPASITPNMLEKIIAFLAPLFLDITAGDLSSARQTATTVVAGFDPQTDYEVQLSALIVAFGLGALDSLSRSAAPDTSPGEALRLRANANALSRSAQQSKTRLDQIRQQAEDSVPAAADGLPESTSPDALKTYARGNMNALLGKPVKPGAQPPALLSRQQRRATEREAAKKQRQQEQEAKRAERLARQRAAMATAGGASLARTGSQMNMAVNTIQAAPTIPVSPA